VTTRSTPTSRRRVSGVVSATAREGGSRRTATTPSVQVAKSPKMRDLLQTTKVETRVVGPIERMLLAEGEDQSQDERRQDVLHVSELARPEFCPRAAYLRITGATPPEASAKLRLQAIFEEGHDVHAKWQRWARRLGRLYGQWQCAVCESRWMATSPSSCPTCSAPGWKLLYKEVPVDREDDYFIIGHGDGQLDGPDGEWIEIKTVGIGTVRMEAPKLLMKYTRKGITLGDIDSYLEWLTGQYREEFLSNGKLRAQTDDIPKSIISGWVDFDGLWKDIRHPFPAHLRQGHTYGGLMGVEEVVFIYEYKPTQAHKEFVVKVSPRIYEPIIETALDVKWAVEKGRAPRCPHGGCKQCKTSVQTKEQQGDKRPEGDTNTTRPATSRRRIVRTPQDSRPDVGSRQGDDPSQGRDREDGDRVRPTARRRVTRTPTRPDGAGRQPANGRVHELHGLGRLLRDATGVR
jgi:rubrerythrin